MLCPVGTLETFDPGGGATVVKAAHEFGVAHMLSSVCEPGLEAVAQAAPAAPRMFQLYVRGDQAWVDAHVERAMAQGCAAFCLTVDTAIYSRRERDIAKRHMTTGRIRASGSEFQAALDWRIPAKHAGALGEAAKAEVIEQAGHMVQTERAGKVNDLVLAHIRS